MPKPKYMLGEAYDLYVSLDFGKHKGTRVNEIIKEKPEYLIWCLDTIDGFALTDDAMAELDNATV